MNANKREFLVSMFKRGNFYVPQSVPSWRMGTSMKLRQLNKETK